MSSEWMRVMLEEISRKKAEAELARAEEQAREEQAREERTSGDQQGRRAGPDREL
jgi:hypothetical protein